MTDPLTACNTDSSSPFLSLVVQADRDLAPGLRGRAIRAASMKRPGACVPAAASKHRGRTGDTPSRSGPASHRAQSHAPYTTRTDQEEHERPSLLCP